MGMLSAVQTIWADTLEQLSQSTILTTSTGSTPQLVLDDPVSGTRTLLNIVPGNIDPAQAQVIDLDPPGATYSVSVNGRTGDLPSQVFGSRGDSGYAWLDGIGFAGNLVAVHRLSAVGQDWLLLSPVHGQGISSYRINSDGSNPELVTRLDDTASSYLSGIAAIDSIWVGGTPFVVTASTRDDTVSVLQLGSNGQLWPTDQLGAAQALPIDRPTVLQTVSLGDKHFVVTGSFGTSSLTVMEIGQGGSLSFVDQINDTLGTRFGQTSALDIATIDGHVFVAAAGSDGGVSLFQMLPDGRLVHRETLIDELDTALDAISELRFAETPNGLELFAISTRDTGLTRIEVETGTLGVIGEGPTGTSGNDIISPAAGAQNIRGEAGDDILVDGTGADTLWGGSGADIFVFSNDGQPDEIADFNPNEDRIDLSDAGHIHDISSLSIQNISGGLRLAWDDEILVVRAVRGTGLNSEIIAEVIAFETDRVQTIERAPLMGTPGNDTFLWAPGADTVNGAGGTDRKDYSNAPLAVVVSLDDAGLNAMAADGDILISIEQVVGTSDNDTILGNAAANTLTGLEGNDVIRGEAGSDWLMPGEGNNTVQGGSGTDMLSVSDLPTAANINLREGRLTAGGYESDLQDIENVTGTIFADVIEGDDGNNLLRGLGHYDWFISSWGSDHYDGGSGRDMISYVNAPAAVTVNLQQGEGQAGQAVGDTYTSIERVTGSIYSDLIYGGAMDEDIRGIGGYDWFIGSPGRDRFDGGSGVDTVAYWTSTTGVVASLSLGRGAAGDANRDLYTSIEGLTGSAFADQLTGDNERNVLRGLGGADTLDGRGGVDRLEGGAGNDIIDGGWGWDVAIFSGDRDEYTITSNANGILTIQDDLIWRDGIDRLQNIEALQFADGLFYF